MGELFAYFLAADIAFIGGSLVDAGCQNVIESIACNVPTLFGPSTYNFAEVCRSAVAAGAAKQVASAEEWLTMTRFWLSDKSERQQYADAATAFVRRHRGASAHMAELISEAVKERLGKSG